MPADPAGLPAVTGKIRDIRESDELGSDDLACKLLAAYATSAITFGMHIIFTFIKIASRRPLVLSDRFWW